MNLPDNPFQEKIKKQVERFQHDSFSAIEAEVAQKRIAWFRQNYPSGIEQATPRRAYEVLFFEYMGLNPSDVPVVSVTENEIVWLSYNACQTLEACKLMGLDTRQVCRAAFENSTQALISMIDPQLHFGRSYEEIRPYALYCREWIRREDSQG